MTQVTAPKRKRWLGGTAAGSLRTSSSRSHHSYNFGWVWLMAAAIVLCIVIFLWIPGASSSSSSQEPTPLALDPKQKLTTRLRSKPQSVVGVTGKEDVGMKVGGLKKKEEGPTDDGDVERLFEPAKTLKTSTYIRFELENLNPDDSSFTSGEFVLELKPEWAPLGVARFHELTAQQFWDECRFFRVFEKFVAQFGINGSPEINDKWKDQAILDDPVGPGNERGTLTMATSGKNTRSTQLFINKQNNKYLDKEGFAPIGQIIRGMDVVDRIYFGYSGDGSKAPNQGKISRQGNEYLKEYFPKLSYISKATYIDESEIMDQKES